MVASELIILPRLRCSCSELILLDQLECCLMDQFGRLLLDQLGRLLKCTQFVTSQLASNLIGSNLNHLILFHASKLSSSSACQSALICSLLSSELIFRSDLYNQVNASIRNTDCVVDYNNSVKLASCTPAHTWAHDQLAHQLPHECASLQLSTTLCFVSFCTCILFPLLSRIMLCTAASFCS
ncbi:hypothetical protein F511_04165 [Dorcoceras hygrometricum]|uniref:Uncharacterized protein n=1 Tax=Dorcoceras hygrometricum TaxID=472368 RepID=A0A2Z7BI43_9LAMI|nr:hypothetical protein F511_04165 [Dorcoceras hygrometricum]